MLKSPERKKSNLWLVVILVVSAIASLGISAQLEQAYAIFSDDRYFHSDCHQMTLTGSCINLEYPVLKINQPLITTT